jgi:hypothetical protein
LFCFIANISHEQAPSCPPSLAAATYGVNSLESFIAASSGKPGPMSILDIAQNRSLASHLKMQNTFDAPGFPLCRMRHLALVVAVQSLPEIVCAACIKTSWLS